LCYVTEPGSWFIVKLSNPQSTLEVDDPKLRTFKNKKCTIKAVFHGAMSYMLLNDAAYNKVRKSFKEVIADL